MRLVVRGIAENEIDGLLRFAARMYGDGAYQASRRYFDWLYVENPSSRGRQDCLVAIARDTIVGCVHRMRLPCVDATGAGAGTLASLQNHVIEPQLRGGAGIMLLQRAVRGEDFTFSPGVGGRLREAYRRLGYSETPSFWLMHWLNPIMALVQRLGRGATHDRWPAAHLHLRRARFLSRKSGPRGLNVTEQPNDDQLGRMTDDLARQAQSEARRGGGAYVPWNPMLLRWRYFSPGGPRHLLVERPGSRSWAVVSHGVRGRITLTRLLEHESASDGGFVDDVLRVGADLGASLATCYTLREGERDRLLADGWWARTDAPSSFRKASGLLALTGGATDVGFEALQTDVVA